ncbi:hypothetical protein MMC28_010798, partial [Mycoblastus sanguinarius]|nr:hypothetical protein [Mycoblastus sanguinarius]
YLCQYIGNRNNTMMRDQSCIEKEEEYLGYEVVHLSGDKSSEWIFEVDNGVGGIAVGHAIPCVCNGQDIVIFNARIFKSLPRPRTEEKITRAFIRIVYTCRLRKSLDRVKGPENFSSLGQGSSFSAGPSSTALSG